MTLSRFLRICRQLLRFTCLIGGPAFVFIAITFAVDTRNFLKHSSTAKGTILELAEKFNRDDGSVFFAPVFEFVAADKNTFRITSTTGSNPPEFQIGETVPVLYEPEHPYNARIDSFLQLWLFPLVFGGIGVISAAIGWLFVLYERRREQKNAVAATA